MRILICDDSLYDVEEMKTLCAAYLNEHAFEGKIIGITSPLHLDQYDTDVLILDIEMPGFNGIEVKENLMYKLNSPLIIFATNYAEAMKAAYGSNVIGFLTKPIDKMELWLYLDKAVKLLPSGRKVKLNDDEAVSSENIKFVTVEKVYTEVHFADGSSRRKIRKPLREWEEELLDIGFIRINDACIVNCKYVDSFKNREIMLEGIAEPFIVAKRRVKDCKEWYDRYCERMARYI